MKGKSILITGASGFIGSFLTEEALVRGYTVFAAVRRSSSRAFLSDPRITFVEFDFQDKSRLAGQLREFHAHHGKLDYVIHNAGLTKAKTEAEYYMTNFTLTRNFVEALIEAGSVTGKFIFISSLAAMGPGRTEDQPIRLTDVPNPVTAYGKSKLKAEEFFVTLRDFPYMIIRPTNVYGPREKDIFIFFRMINNYFEPYIGLHKQKVSFIYVRDLVKAIFLAIDSPLLNKTYFAADGKEYDTRILGKYIRQHLGRRTFSISIPVSLVRMLTTITGALGQVSALNTEKLNELEAKNWMCDAGPLMQELGFSPDFDLESGVKETIEWYKREKWL